MEIGVEFYKLQVILEKELSEIRKLLIPISLYYAEQLKICKSDKDTCQYDRKDYIPVKKEEDGDERTAEED